MRGVILFQEVLILLAENDSDQASTFSVLLFSYSFFIKNHLVPLRFSSDCNPILFHIFNAKWAYTMFTLIHMQNNIHPNDTDIDSSIKTNIGPQSDELQDMISRMP